MAGSGETIHVDLASFKHLARDIRRAAPGLSAELKRRLRAAGAGIVAQAKARASYSTRIPGSIKSGARGLTVVIQAGGSRAPNAVPIENKGRGFVRHPVFVPRAELPGPAGSWTDANSHPAFLAPAFKEGAAEAAAEIGAAVDSIVRQIAEEGVQGG
jgi:hypothetical protein